MVNDNGGVWRAKALCAVVGSLVSMNVAGCKSGQQADGPPPLTRNQRLAALQTRPAEVSGPIESPGERSAAEPARLIARQRLEAPSAGPEEAASEFFDGAPGETVRVKYTAREALAADVVRVLVGEFLGRPFIVDSALRGTVTLDVDAELTTAEIESLLGAVASLYGWTLEDRDGVMVVSAGDTLARTQSAPILRGRSAIGGDLPAVRIFPLAHLTPTQAADAVREFQSEEGKSATVGRLFIAADRMGHLNRLGTLLHALDVPAFDGAEIWTYQLTNQDPVPVVQMLDSIAGASNLNTGADASVSFVALPGAQRVMVVARDPSVQTIVRRWIEQIDAPRDDTTRRRYFYKVQHFDPSDIVRVVQEFMTHELEADPSDPNDTGMRLTSAAEEDLLLIYATAANYADLLALLSRIDAPRPQVFLQSVIAEVNLSDALAYGVEYFLQVSTGEGDFEFVGDAIQSIVPTGSAFFVGSDGFALIEALDRETDVQLLSAPSLFVEDRAEASIQVGGETPILTSATQAASQSGGDTDVFNDIVYRPTGVTLNVQPRINETGSVQLRIRQEISDAIENSSSAIDSPEFTTRVVETVVTVRDGQTLVLGGIISSRDTETVEKIPLLGDAPLVGPLFRGIDRQSQRVELVLAITPTIIHDPGDAPIVTSRFLEAVEGVRDALEEMDMSPSEKVDEDVQRMLNLGPGADADPATPAPGESIEKMETLAMSLPAQHDELKAFLLSMVEHARDEAN